MMYFSRIAFNPLVDHQRLAQILCQDTYREHQALWRLFDSDPDAKRDFLYRQAIEGGRVKYYVLSNRIPVDESGIWLIDTPKHYSPKLSEGQKLFFMLRVNPVVTRSVDRDNPKKYLMERAQRDVIDKNKLTRKCISHDVVMHEKTKLGYQQLSKHKRPPLQQLVQDSCIQWLDARAGKNGFAFQADSVIADGYRQHKSPAKKKKHSIRYSTVDFQGILTVTDSDLFKSALFSGIGKSKAFGCGLMLIRRA